MSAELTAPFTFFGAKRHAAGLIWQALGDVASYCEPFAGSLAVLLRRPSRPSRIETVNDLSGHIANFWRAVKVNPDEVARHIDYPVVEQDLHARHRWLLAHHDDLVAGLDADPEWCDAKAAGWWAWGMSAWIGSGWCDPRNANSGIGAQRRGQLPALGNAGKGIHRRQLSDMGKGIHRRQLGNAGRAVHSVGGVEAIGEWIGALADRLRRVRVCCGDWRRVVTHSALCDRLVGGRVGILYDPPYSLEAGKGVARTPDLYGAQDDAQVAAATAEQARQQAVDHPAWRIVLCGYEGEHVMPGWREVAWDPSVGKWGSGGYGRRNGNPQRERLWLSPACLDIAEQPRQLDLVGGTA